MRLIGMVVLSLAVLLGGTPARGQRSPRQLGTVPFGAVHVNDPFWSPRIETNRTVTIPYDFKKCEETGRINNFAVAGGLVQGRFEGIPFNDSDVYKVIEGAAYSLAVHPDPALEKYLDALALKIAAAQEPDGYLYTARTIIKDGRMPSMSGQRRWLNEASSHELYNAGHFYEAAVAYFQATGKRGLLDVAVRNADLIDKVFGPGPGQLQLPPGHEEIEIGLVKLYHATRQEKYLKLAKFFVDARGNAAGHRLYGEYNQDHVPVAGQTEAVGHAVRAAYLYSGVADVAALTGDARDLQAIDRIWENAVSCKMYLTGGIGSRANGEAFGTNYELPNATAYNETCAAIANALWNYRMFLLHGDAQYLDVLERVIYNGFLSGISLSGDRFFYPNPLEADGKRKFNMGETGRSPWFDCSCCPVNVVRFIPSIPGYIYATGPESIYVNLFVGGKSEIKLGGRTVNLAQETRYPWDGRVKLGVDPESAGAFDLRVRIPGWAQGRPVPSDLYRYADATAAPATLKVNGQPVGIKLEKGFAVIRREWKKGDTVELELPMPVRRVLAHGSVKADAGRVAVERGPLVFCAEGADNGPHVLDAVLADDGAAFTEEFKAGLLGGVLTLRTRALAIARDDAGDLTKTPVPLTLIPYYAWCNRGAGEMEVWFPRTADLLASRLPKTLAGLSRVSASFAYPADSLSAPQDGVEPARSGDQSIPRFTWWDHRGTAEWLQYDLRKPARVSAVEVYWFDDTGAGQCRVPQSWRLLAREGDGWKPVEGASDYGIKKNQYNRVTFTPVSTGALRLEVKLQPGFSGGVLEWNVQ